MTQLLDFGPMIMAQGVGVNNLAFTPQADRSAHCIRIQIEAVSATDQWQVLVGGREIMRFHVHATNRQNLLTGASFSVTDRRNIFDVFKAITGIELLIPIPNGQILTVQSVGAATATITLTMREVQPTDTPPTLMNHYLGSTFYMPITGYVNASVAAVGLAALDTTVRPGWVPDPFTGVALPVGWRETLISIYPQAGGVNTFSGAANHASTTRDLQATKNGQSYFSRANLGMPAIGVASAAGSANTVYGSAIATHLAFNEVDDFRIQDLGAGVVLNGGDNLKWSWDIIGDVTGGASYAGMTVVCLVKVEQLLGAS